MHKHLASFVFKNYVFDLLTNYCIVILVVPVVDIIPRGDGSRNYTFAEGDRGNLACVTDDFHLLEITHIDTNGVETIIAC